MQHAAKDEDVGPAVRVEIVHEGKHAVARHFFQRLRQRRVEFVARLEPGSLIPIRARDDVRPAIAVKIAGVDAVAKILVGQDCFFKAYGWSLVRQGDGPCSRGEEERKEGFHEGKFASSATKNMLRGQL